MTDTLKFLAREMPYFHTGYSVSFALLLMVGFMATVMMLIVWRENRARAAGKRDHLLRAPDVKELGDGHPSYRYTF